ncbi:hypothetical protein K490DRAFT_46950 [Saccharata proteae CBS 121410]|uniref:Uncharacterized protein n=1 Tax=Saccharata proteae CBS 121410 TaxID=1314787 RepID=A0A9P4LXW0_9PEZI|nr:hypothetical protein K490DRAFT_46950 [Saccharata proteae CBS 121410]
MAQQYQRFSPYPPPAGSPMQTSPVGIAPPPKRQRLSPNPASPYSPYAATSPYASQPGTPAASFAGLNPQTPLSFNQPELAQPPMGQQSFDAGPRQGPGSMGPPQRPAERPEKEKPTDINDLSDVIGASGIDLREEENYLAQTYQNQHQNASFATSATTASPAALSPNNSFTQLGQGSFGAYRAFQGSGPVSQPPVSQEAIEAEIEEKQKAAARALAESQQQELNNPFLKGNSIRKRVGNIAYEQGVRINVDGVYDRVAPRVKGIQAVGSDGTGIAAVEAAALIDHNAPYQEILTLISLAAKDRLRSVLEDAYGLSRGRRFGSHGVVPPEFSDIAVGDPNQQQQPATAVPTSVTKTAWDQPDSAVSPMTVPMKRVLLFTIPDKLMLRVLQVLTTPPNPSSTPRASPLRRPTPLPRLSQQQPTLRT